jgi:hypothetical protein
MDTSIGAIITLLLPVPAFVAYRHPEAYKVLSFAFFVIGGIVYIGLQVWDFGALVMYHTMRSYIDREKLDAAEKAANALYILNWKWVVGWLCLFAYMGFLDLLPKLGIVAPDAAKKAPASDGSVPHTANSSDG